jgi:membrane fusion protein, multidrug efflux system
MLSVVPVQSVYLIANFKETQIKRMRVGQKATFKVDALGGQEIDAEVESFAPGTGAQFALLPPENATGNFIKIVQRVPVRLHVTAPKEIADRLLPGLSVVVTVNTLDEEHRT